METITLPKVKYLQLLEEVRILRKSKLYKRLLEAETNIAAGKRYIRADVGY